MIKAITVLGGRPALVLGLSGENVTRLMAGEPCLVDTASIRGGQVELPVLRVLLVGGRTEQTILAELQSAGGPLEQAAKHAQQLPAGGTHELLMRMLHGEASRWRSADVDPAQRIALDTCADTLERQAAQIAELLESPPGIGATLIELANLFQEAAGTVSLGAGLEGNALTAVFEPRDTAGG